MNTSETEPDKEKTLDQILSERRERERQDSIYRVEGKDTNKLIQMAESACGLENEFVRIHMLRKLLANLHLPLDKANEIAWTQYHAIGEFPDLGIIICARADVTTKIQEDWMNDKLADRAQRTVANNPNTSLELLKKWVVSEHEQDVIYALHSGRLPALVDSFANHTSASVRACVAIQTKSPAILRELANDAKSQVRLGVVKNPATEQVIIETVALTEMDWTLTKEAIARVVSRAALRQISDMLKNSVGKRNHLLIWSCAQALLKNKNSEPGVKALARQIKAACKSVP